MNKAVFLDRDGTINREVNYLKRKEDLEILPGVKEALTGLKKLGFLNIIITNQSGIARGYFTLEDLSDIHREMNNMLMDRDDFLIDDIFLCPYHIDGIIPEFTKESEDRKPEIGMIKKALKKHNIDLSSSYFIGDTYTDMLTAQNSGLHKILLKTGYGTKDYITCIKNDVKIDYFAENLLDAYKYIENKLKN